MPPQSPRLPNLRYERELRADGHSLIAGIDEAGRGPLAGPVSAAAVILPEKFRLAGLNDSKKLTAKRRDELFDALTGREDVVWSVVLVDAAEIVGVVQFTMPELEVVVPITASYIHHPGKTGSPNQNSKSTFVGTHAGWLIKAHYVRPGKNLC